jgi:hypothetical protein
LTVRNAAQAGPAGSLRSINALAGDFEYFQIVHTLE